LTKSFVSDKELSLSGVKRFLNIDPLFFLSTTILVCTLRMVVPHINYLFIPLFFFFFLLSAYHFSKENITGALKVFFRYNFLLIIAVILILLGNILSGKIIVFAIREFLNAIVVMFFAFSFFQFIKTRDSFEKFTQIFIKQILFFSVLVSLLGLIKYIFQLAGIDLSFFIPSFQFGTSLNTDYNFNVLFSFLGIIALAFNYGKISRIRFVSFLTILLLNIIFSGSRRGLFFLAIVVMLCFIWFIYNHFEIKMALFRIVIFVSFLVISVSILSIYREKYTLVKKNQSLDLLKNTPAKKTIAQIAFRYFTFINSEKSSYELYLDLWAPNWYKGFSDFRKNQIKQDSNNLIYNGNFKYGLKFWYPQSSQVRHEIISTPFGNGVRVTKSGTDKSGWPLQYAGRDIIFYAGHTYELKFKYKVLKGEGVPFNMGINIYDPVLGYGKTNLFKFISDIGNNWKQGRCCFTNWESLHEVPFFMNIQELNTIIEFADISLKDLNPIDSLPAFTDQVSNDSRKIGAFLRLYDSCFFQREKDFREKETNLVYNGNFKEGTRYWLPAASGTKHKIIETPYGNGIKITRNNGDNGFLSLQYCGRPIIYHAGHTYKLSFFLKVEKGVGVPFNVGWLAEDSIKGYQSAYRPLELVKQSTGWTQVICYNIFLKDHLDLPFFIHSQKDSTEIDIAGVKMEDLDKKNGFPIFVDELYNNNEEKTDIIDKKELSFTDIHSGFYSSRFDRWKYSKVIFMDSMSFSQKIFGKGFDYIYMFGRKLNEGEIDYPHNPFLSTLIFSGIIGFLVYLWYFLSVIILYIRSYRRHRFFFISFIIVFCFSFVSSNTHFSVPVFAILCIIPFLTKYILDLESKGQSGNQHI
jgi:hypothetical protein